MPTPKPISYDGLMRQLGSFRSFFYFHGYQPPRKLCVNQKVIYDITGEFDNPGGFNERIWQRCYRLMGVPITQPGVDNPDTILGSKLVSGHLFGTTRDWLKHHHPGEWEDLREILLAEEIPFVDPYLHPIFPLIPPEIQELMVDIGIKAWEQDMEIKLVNKKGQPLMGFGFWLPELGVNQQTIEILSKKGVRFLMLDRHQIKTYDFAPFYEIPTQTHGMYVLAYDGAEFAQKLAFSDIKNAKPLVDQIRGYKNYHHFPPLAAMDMETYGEWRGMDSMWFLNYFTHNTLSLDEMKRDPKMMAFAGVHDATSWSCAHQLGRWTGKNNCSCDGANDELRRRKNELYQGLYDHVQAALKKLHEVDNWQEPFINFFLNTRSNLAIGENIDFTRLEPAHQKPFESLYVALVGFTSCGWFYAGELERQIPNNTLSYLNEKNK